jgi:hypothetical protein
MEANMIWVAAAIIAVLVLTLAWEILRRFSCLNCLLGLLFIGIALALLVIGGILQISY